MSCYSQTPLCFRKFLITLPVFPPQLEEQAKAKSTQGNVLDVYFSRLERLRKGSALDSRIKFGIQVGWAASCPGLTSDPSL